MKKLVSFLLAAAMVLGCTACGSSGNSAASSGTVSQEPSSAAQSADDGGAASAPFQYPKKQLTLVVAGGAGSNMDVMARALAPYLGKIMGTNAVVENVSGGGGVTAATAYLAESANTDKILMQSVSNLLVAPLFNQVSYTSDDFVSIIGMADAAQGVFSDPSKSKIKSFDDLKNFSKDQTLKYGSGGPAVWNGLLQADLYQKIGIKAETVPHNSAGEGITNIMGGHTQVTLASMAQANDYVLKGSLVPLFTFADEPYQYDNGVTAPTLKSLGYDENIPSFTYWAIRKGTDEKLVKYLYSAFHQAYQDPDFKKDMQKLGNETYDVDGDAIEKIIDESIPDVKEMYKAVHPNG